MLGPKSVGKSDSKSDGLKKHGLPDEFLGHITVHRQCIFGCYGRLGGARLWGKFEINILILTLQSVMRAAKKRRQKKNTQKKLETAIG